MAKEDLEIWDVPDSAADSDEIIVLYATPAAIKRGASRSDAIPVENYPLRSKRVIDLSHDSSYFNDEVQLIHSPSRRKIRFLKGECSNSKSSEGKESDVSLKFECEICADEKPSSVLFRILGCDHSYCSECVGKYVAGKLQENVSKINCPVVGCNGFLKPHHCYSILPKPVFDRWGDALCEALILASEKFYCPFKDCSALLIDDRGGNGGVKVVESECPNCNRLFCARCKVPWHSGVSCEEFGKLKEDERGSEDVMLMSLAKTQKWTRCSKCGFIVERTQGCAFMRCRCGYTFCYHCGDPLKDHYCSRCKR